MKRINRNRYLMTAMLASLLVFSATIESNMQATNPLEQESSQVSIILDPKNDLVYIYTGEPAKEYFKFIDITEVKVEKYVGVLYINITVVEAPPAGLINTIFYTFMFDENNDPSDNRRSYPTQDVDTMYTVIYTKTGGWTIERARYQVVGDWWMVEPTITHIMFFTEPKGFTVRMALPLAELPRLAELVPWKVKTETFTYPSTFPATGDFVPNEGLACLKPTKIVVTNLYHSQIIVDQTPTLTGIVLDPAISEVNYKVSSMIHEKSGKASVVDGSFSFDLDLTEGINFVTVGYGTAEESLILEVDASAPLVSFTVTDKIKNYTYFNWVDSFNIFTEGKVLLSPPFEHFRSEILKQETDKKTGNLVYQEIVYYDRDGKKVGDEHTTWEYDDKGIVKKMTKTYTDKDGKPTKTIITEGKQVIEKTHDDKGRVNKETYKIPGLFGFKERTFEYDDKDRVKKATETYVDKNGKLIGKGVWEDYEYDDSKRKKVTGKFYDENNKLVGKGTWECEYDGKKIKKIKITEYDENDVLWGTREYTYDYKPLKTIEKWVIKDKDGKIIDSGEREIKATRQKVEIDWFGKKKDKSTKSMEYRFDSDLPNFTEPTAFIGKIVISDFGTNPTIPPVGTYTVMISIDNSTGSYEEIFYVVGNSLEFNVTLSMNTTIKIMVIDEAGHIGVNTIQIPLPLVSDIDCDNVVNILDIAIVAKAFGAVLGSERWDFFADVNNDDVVNILDIARVAIDFRLTY